MPTHESGHRCLRVLRACLAAAVRLPIIAGAALGGGCHGPRSVLDPASSENRAVNSLWWIFCGVGIVVFCLVVAFLLGAIWRARREAPATAVAAAAVVEPGAALERRLARIVGSAVAVTVATLVALLLVDFAAGRALHAPAAPDPLTIRITGHQWWWQIEYDDPAPANLIQTANELHLPTGRPVQLILKSTDVIHSLWLPSLQGKKDLIPGKTSTLWVQPDKPGVYRGQCAEFCGYQHAHMGLVCTVESPEDFARWQTAQRQPAVDPANASQRRGREVFLTTSCVLCHTIQGTSANSRVGPPLTHLASQHTIGAGSFPNNRGYLAGWILDPQSLKPGTKMPANSLGADDLQALLDYLQSLK